MLELVDSMIDDIEAVTISEEDRVDIPTEMAYASGILEVIVKAFPTASLPDDRRRLADTVAAWTTAASLSPVQLSELLRDNPDLVNARSIDPASAILGCILRSNADQLITRFEGRLLISFELESLCLECSRVPTEMRIQIS